MSYDVRSLTRGPLHHLFGFHDLVQTNARGDLALSLEVEDISRPPLPGESCGSGIVGIDESLSPSGFLKIHDTHTWNYPQGARQQWLDESDLFTCNDRDAEGKVFAWISDARARKVVQRLPFPVHGQKNGVAVFPNYDRLHAVGAYGYVPGRKRSGVLRLVDVPADDGLWRGDLKTGETTLLASLAQIAAVGERRPVRTGFPHYVSHPMLNPTGTRVAFLHRYRVPDGGETTRLMTVGMDGSGLRCLAKGFLSHFTWTAEDEIFIWGAHQPGVYAMREAGYLRVPGMLPCVKLAKKCIKAARSLIRRGQKSVGGGVPVQSMTFLRIKDADESCIVPVGRGVLTEDGHPMACPGRLHTLINDTYPHADGNRTLMFYDLDTGVRTDVGMFRMLDLEPDLTTFDGSAAQTGTDVRILHSFNRGQYFFARSGLHCDLHPRWAADGRSVLFDSIHEGTRQVYLVREGIA